MLKWKVFLFSLCVIPSAGGGGGGRVGEAVAGGQRGEGCFGRRCVGGRGPRRAGFGRRTRAREVLGPERGSGIGEAGDRVGRASRVRGRGYEGLKFKGVSVEGGRVGKRGRGMNREDCGGREWTIRG